ncbi:hypothetical protein H4Q32_030010 [Labeo rohita]|uniref:Uncharacterized protein n=1 Tax=Labeo rohita TaxID=84645 RepID=A0ABQ8LAI3_LABRO|nr:hypothetical protein H4Q32_030010 [Labeo rohita]
MDDHGFYVTLPCNSSLTVYPENRISSFTTRLAKTINLKGDWQVALAEIKYPRSWYTFNDTDGFFSVRIAPVPSQNHLKSAAKNIVSDVVSNALSRSYNDNTKTQDGSGLMVMARKRLSKLPVPLTQTVIEKNAYLEVPPLSAISVSLPLEFFVAGNGEDYIDLNNTLLYLRLKITRPNGGDIPDPAKSSNTYPYRCIIDSLINYSGDALESLFSVGLFFKDTAGYMDETDPVGHNTGLTKRSLYTTGSKVVELLAPIHSDIFFQEKFILNGVDIKIRMIRAKNEFCLMRCDDIAYKLNIVSASLLVKKVTISPSVRLGHAQALLSSTAKYPIDRVCLKKFSIPTGARVSNQENLFLGTLLKSIILGMVDNDAFTSAYDKNLFAFKHYDLEFLAGYANRQQFPAKPLQPDFAGGSAIREFYQKDSLKGYTLYAFNLKPDEDCGQHISLIKSGNIRLEARFKQLLAHIRLRCV